MFFVDVLSLRETGGRTDDRAWRQFFYVLSLRERGGCTEGAWRQLFLGIVLFVVMFFFWGGVVFCFGFLGVVFVCLFSVPFLYILSPRETGGCNDEALRQFFVWMFYFFILVD